MELTIRKALPSDALFLTSISFGAKRYWNYPEEYFEVWHNELTITEDYIEQNIVYVAQKKDTIIGYFSIVEIRDEYWNGDVFIKAGYWLDHMYIRPAYIRNGIGTELMEYAEQYCRENGIDALYIVSDPFANGFYEKIGATYIGESPSSIENRTVSLYEYHIPDKTREQIEEELLLQRIQEELERERQEAEEAERLRQEAEEEERLRQEAEEEERLRQEAEEAERLRQEAEEEERLRQEAEEAERLRQEAEEAERLRQEAEEAERLRQEAEEAERLRQEAEEAERLRQEAEESERLRQEAEEERLEERAREIERLRREQEEAEETERLVRALENSSHVKSTTQKETTNSKKKNFFGLSLDSIIHRPIKLEHEKMEQKILELDKEYEDSYDDKYVVADQINSYAINHRDQYLEQDEKVLYEEDIEDEDIIYDEDIEEVIYEEDEEALYENDREIQIPKLQLDEAEIAALIAPSIDSMHESLKEKSIHIPTEKEKMLSGELYIAWGDEFIEDKRRARKLLREFNNIDVEDKKATMKILKELFGSTGEYIHIEPQFKCDYGYNIHIGDNFYAGYDCVILDSSEVRIGNNCILSPQVGIYTATYPLNAEKRAIGYEYAKPITIGNNVWIGGGAIINPGVTIGDNVVVAPGSVVVGDIPSNVLVGGNPAKIIKEIETEK